MRIAVANIKNKLASQFLRSSSFYRNEKRQSIGSKLVSELLFKSWWTITFIILCLFAYTNALEMRKSEKLALQKKVSEINKEKEKAISLKEELELQIYSQNDAAWIELTLMKGLGLVPEGNTKIFFMQEKNRK